MSTSSRASDSHCDKCSKSITKDVDRGSAVNYHLRMSTDTELAWAAGIVDGEGCLHINRHRLQENDRRTNESFRAVLKVTMGHLATIEKLAEIFEIGTIHQHVERNSRINRSYSYITQCLQTGHVVQMVLPYLITKREEAVLVLDFLSLPNGDIGGSGGNRCQTSEEVEARLRYYWQMRMLKSRWRFFRKTLRRSDVAELKKLGLE